MSLPGVGGEGGGRRWASSKITPNLKEQNKNCCEIQSDHPEACGLLPYLTPEEHVLGTAIGGLAAGMWPSVLSPPVPSSIDY